VAIITVGGRWSLGQAICGAAVGRGVSFHSEQYLAMSLSSSRVPLALPVPSSELPSPQTLAPVAHFGRTGITLVEMLVALAVTLLMMGAVISVFGFIGERVTDSRSLIETNDRLRSAAHRLREDFTSITVEGVPWQRPDQEQGYLEILEGPERDYPRNTSTGRIINAALPVAIRGDIDDVLMGTVRTKGDPYRGKFQSSSVESNSAEIVWYCRPGFQYGDVQTYVLCRRQMLIVPQGTSLGNAPPGDAFYESYDVSARVQRVNNAPTRIANTLGDLTKRENRFAHTPTYPHAPVVDAQGGIRTRFPDTREGEEVVLTNVLSFNVQVFDPGAEVRSNGAAAVEPGDPGYIDVPANNNNPARGAYMDLGDTSVPGVIFGAMANDAATKSGLSPSNRFVYSTYDTWSFHYEHDGIDQNNDRAFDPGTNGLDDNPQTNPGVDDVSERETSPPYPYPLRGLRVKLRVYEPSSKQVREMTVVQSFVPE
jgi:hypothetical protein